MKTSKVSEVIEISRSKEKNNLESQLAAMASDGEIQKELHQINEEFSIAESDGASFLLGKPQPST